MTRIIVDLTEFNTWSGHLTGVQRVVYGIARSLNSNEKNVEFVRFNDRHKLFEAVSFEQFTAITSEVKAASVAGDSISTDTKRMKRFAKKVYNKAPLWVRNKMTPARKERLLRNAKQLYHTAQTLRTRSSTLSIKIDAEQFQFKKGDTIISAGRAWDNDTYLNSLETLRKQSGIKLAYVVYDLIPIYQQHTFGPGLTERFSKYLYRILKNSDYLLPISESTHRDVLKFADEIGIFDLPVIKTIRLGDDISSPAETAPVFVRNPSAFTICVGTIEARKNHAEIYYAYKLAAEKGVELPDLYIVGSPGWLTSDVIYFMQHDTDVKDKITIVHNVADEDLAWLYKNALFTVYPSQYEGWGLPVAESLAFGTPCISTTASSMREIAPDYVDLVSPFDTGELLERMAHYSTPKNSLKQRQVIEAGYKLYSWDKLARALQKLILN